MKISRKILEKTKSIIYSIPFRMKHRLFRGKIRVDFFSMSKSKIHSSINIAGYIKIINSKLTIKKLFALSPTAELSLENNATVHIGESVSIGPQCIISTSSKIIIGDRTTFFSDCIVSGNVQIGSDCLFAKNVSVLTGTHEIHGPGKIRENDRIASESFKSRLHPLTKIGNDCWLGSNVFILPGINLAKGVVVGSNAVVTKDFPEYSIVGGVPAKLIGYRSKDIKKIKSRK